MAVCGGAPPVEARRQCAAQPAGFSLGRAAANCHHQSLAQWCPPKLLVSFGASQDMAIPESHFGESGHCLRALDESAEKLNTNWQGYASMPRCDHLWEDPYAAGGD